MQRRLTKFLLAVIALSIVYGVSAFFWTKERVPVEPTPLVSPLVTAAVALEPLQEPIESPQAPAAEVGELRSPKIIWMEFPGRRVVLEGSVSTAEERRALQKILAKIYSKETKFDNQLSLDQDCGLLSWRDILAEIDLSALANVWDLKCELSNLEFKVTGKVESQAAGKTLLQTLSRALPGGVTLSNDLEAGLRPKSSVSVWMAPNMTYLITGSLPEGMGADLLTLVKRSIPAGALVVDDLIENRFSQQPSWMGELQGFLPDFLKETQRSRFRISQDNQVKIEGIAKSVAIPGIRRRIANAFPPSRFKIETDLKLGVSSDRLIEVEERKVSFDELVATSKIFFRSGRSRVSQLTAEERAKLDRLGQQWVNEGNDQKVYVFGFTDASGDAVTNAYVSKSRCSNVVLYLTKNFGIDQSYFEVVGVPDEYVPDPTADANDLRRVEFSLTPELSEEAATTSSETQPTTVLKEVTVDDLLVSNKIYFTSRQVTPSKSDRNKLAVLASALVLAGTTDNVVLYGYSDGKGEAQANKWFTEERCRAVAKILRNGGLPDSQIILRPVIRPRAANGEGENEEEPTPKNSELDETEEPAENLRRVELKLEPPATPITDESAAPEETSSETLP